MLLGPSFSYERRQFSNKNPLSRKPLAVVRFTAYDDHYGEVLKINEAIYPQGPKGVEALRGQILAALEAGFDVSIITSCSVGKLIELLDFANQT